MKLIYCPLCADVFRLTSEWRRCECHASGGQYNQDAMTATVGGVARVLGIGNPFFNEFWPWLPRDVQVDLRNRVYSQPTDAWWGEYPGDQQIFRIADADGPRLQVRVKPATEQGMNVVTVVDKREWWIQDWFGKRPVLKLNFVIVPANPQPSWRGKKK